MGSSSIIIIIVIIIINSSSISISIGLTPIICWCIRLSILSYIFICISTWRLVTRTPHQRAAALITHAHLVPFDNLFENKNKNSMHANSITLLNKLIKTTSFIQIQNDVWPKLVSDQQRSIVFPQFPLGCLIFCVVSIGVSHTLSHFLCVAHVHYQHHLQKCPLYRFLSNTSHTEYTTHVLHTTTYIIHTYNNIIFKCLLYLVSTTCSFYFILFYFWRVSAHFAARFPPLRWGGGCPPLRWGGACTVCLPIGVWSLFGPTRLHPAYPNVISIILR